MPATVDTDQQRIGLHDEFDPLELACGRELAPVEVRFETYGTLNAARDNAIFVCHALTGDADSAGPDGWWRAVVGPGRPVDTERFFVISPNLLGGCRGTTGPSSEHPGSGRAWGLDFPPLAVSDLVSVHRRLLEHLGIERLHAAVGGSLGGMQVLQWLIDAPGQIRRAAIIGASARLSAQNIALSAVAREAILRDPDFRGGDYASFGVRPTGGLSVARRLAHITYLSERGMAQKFSRQEPAGRQRTADARAWLESTYDVESYLDHQAKNFLERFDALSYLYLTRIMDAFDPFGGEPPPLDPDTRTLVLAFDSDWRFGEHHSAAIAAGLRAAGARRVEQVTVESPWGHDSFLLEVPAYIERLREVIG
jgi:homoserine O-acetyltransferase